MIEVKVITNNNISEEAIIDICKIKSVFGEYSFDSQRQWIIDNIKPDDIHFLIYDNNKLIAYANLIEESLFMDEKEINILGLGNVCVDEKGKEKGYLLMSKINNYLIENIDKINEIGIEMGKTLKKMSNNSYKK